MRHLSRWFVTLCALLCIAPLPAQTNEALHGEWWFADGDMRFAMAPPVFDVIALNEDGTLRLASTNEKREITGTFTADGKEMTWLFVTPEKEKIEHRLKYSVRSDGALVIRVNGSPYDCVYLRTKAFLPNKTVAGTWSLQTTDPADSETVTYDERGLVTSPGGDYEGSYRIWNGPAGMMMTQLIVAEGHNLMLISRLRLRSGEMVLTPNTPAGIEAPPMSVYRRVPVTSAKP